MMRIVLIILALFVTGCASPLATFRLSDDVTMDVNSISADGDQFDVHIDFVESNEKYEFLIQEGEAEPGVFLVECWKTDSNGDIRGHDRHWHEGLSKVGGIVRTFRVYTGEVQGADLTPWNRFGMLPENMDGSIATNVNPTVFNTDYFAKHKLQGKIVEKAQVSGTWRLSWLPGVVRIDVGSEYIVCKDGAILVFQVESGR